MSEMNYKISDTASKKQNINYVVNTTLYELRKLNCEVFTEIKNERATLNFSIPDENFPTAEKLITDKIADVIAVNYKYDYFTRYIRTGGLDAIDYEMLMASLIAADLDEDKRYVLSGGIDLRDFSIDGYFNFRLRPLKEKWSEIVTYIPSYFTKDKLIEFVSYIVCEKHGRRAYVYGDKVYDGRFRRMQRSALIKKIEKGSVAREVILSGFSEVELSSDISDEDKKYLSSFFGDKIFFKKREID